MVAYKELNYPKIKELCTLIFSKYGFSEQDSRTVVDVLLAADLHGIESHGIQRLIRYHEAIHSGEVDVNAEPKIVHETPISATINAEKAMGQVVSKNAMDLAIKKAKQSGIGMVTVHHSNHYGIAGYYTEMAVEEDLIGISMTNTEAIMVPTFGKKAMLGSNPISVSMPAEPTPFIFDAATTVVPRGKLEVYNKKGQAMPHGWAIDGSGEENTNPKMVLDSIIGKIGGGILPLGGSGETNAGYKGYGFGLICELFTSVMSGGATSNNAVAQGKNELSHCFWAIDYGVFGDKAEIKKNFSVFLDELRNTPKAPGQDRIYIHGEKELESSIIKQEQGIPVNEKTFSEICSISQELGIDYTSYIGSSF